MRELFEEYIDQKLKGIVFDHIDLVSGGIHKAVGGYPGKGHRMSQCCAAMYRKMQGDDRIIEAPPSGMGAYVKVRYYRRNHK